MRSPPFLSFLCAVTLAACGSQSLDGNKTGSGGVTGGTGGGPGGLKPGGSPATGGPVCNSLAQQYQSAVGAAQYCDVGGPGACSQSVPAALEQCGSCPVFVSDRSAVDAIRQAYDQAGCGGLVPGVNCGRVVCPPANNNVCVSIDGGSKGYCSYVPGTGGTSGGGGINGTGGSPADGGDSNCGSLASEYNALLIAEQICYPNADGQCGQSVPQSLSPCTNNCTTYVNDATGLNAIVATWKQAGCANGPVLCPAIACATPAAGYCGPSDAGPGTCRNAYLVLAK